MNERPDAGGCMCESFASKKILNVSTRTVRREIVRQIAVINNDDASRNGANGGGDRRQAANLQLLI